MKQLNTALCFTLALLSAVPVWAASPSQDEKVQAHNDKLSVSGALYRDDYMLTSFAGTIDNGKSLRARAQVTSSYVSQVSPVGENLQLTPATYEHGYDLTITPVVMPDDSVQLSYQLRGVEILGFAHPAADVTATGAPQTVQLNLQSTDPIRVRFGREDVIDFHCAEKWSREDKQDLQRVNCRYHLVVSVNKASSL